MEQKPIENKTPENGQEQQGPSTILKISVLIVLIVLLIIGVLLPIKLVPNALGGLGARISSIFQSKTVSLTTDKSEIDSGSPFTLSWTGSHNTDGSYSISYACEDGAHLETSISQPNEIIPCNTPFYFSPTENSITLTPYSLTNRFTDVPVTLSFLPNNGGALQTLGNIIITITNPTISTSPSAVGAPTTATTTVTAGTSTVSVLLSPTPTPKATPTPSITSSQISGTRVSNPNGTPDLAVTLISTGYIDPATSRFVPSTSVNAGERGAVEFEIANVGTKNTGPWSFAATLPSTTNPNFVSGTQQNLTPGSHVIYTLNFNNVDPAHSQIIITADPSNLIEELSKNNNTVTASLSVLGNQAGNQTGGYVTGPADLTVNITAVGTINPVTGQFYGTNTVNPGNRVSVQFQVKNVGGTATGLWRFLATLPTANQNSYTSNYESSLAPGQIATFTIGFDNTAYAGNNTITVQVDPFNEVNESSKTNNTASVVITRSY